MQCVTVLTRERINYTRSLTLGKFVFELKLILTILDRFLKICSTYENFHQEVKKFLTIFKLNGYPTRLWDKKCVQLFFDKTFKSTSKTATVPKLLTIYWSSLSKSARKSINFVLPLFHTSTFAPSFNPPNALHIFVFQRQTSQGFEISCSLFFLVSLL